MQDHDTCENEGIGGKALEEAEARGEAKCMAQVRQLQKDLIACGREVKTWKDKYIQLQKTCAMPCLAATGATAKNVRVAFGTAIGYASSAKSGGDAGMAGAKGSAADAGVEGRAGTGGKSAEELQKLLQEALQAKNEAHGKLRASERRCESLLSESQALSKDLVSMVDKVGGMVEC